VGGVAQLVGDAFDGESVEAAPAVGALDAYGWASDPLPDDKDIKVSDLSSERCYSKCGNVSGYCEYFCGVGMACCAKGSTTDAVECRTAKGFAEGGVHECVGIVDVTGDLWMKRMGLWPTPVPPSSTSAESAPGRDAGYSSPTVPGPQWEPSGINGGLAWLHGKVFFVGILLVAGGALLVWISRTSSSAERTRRMGSHLKLTDDAVE